MKKRLLFLLAVFTAFLPVFAIQKPAFMLYNHTLANECSLIDYLQVIFHGLKLDCTIAGYLTVIPFLCILISVWLPGVFFRKILKIYFFITSLLIAIIFSVDIALYSYWGFRLDATLFFYLQSPADAMASVPIISFLIQFVIFLIYTFLIFYCFSRWIIPLFPQTAVKQKIGGTLLILICGGVLFIPIRGGVTTSTANVGMVYFSNNQFLNHSAINPCFSLIASLSKQQDFAAQFNYFQEEQRALIFESLLHSKNDTIISSPDEIKLLTTDRPNILLIIMESFSANAIEAVGGDSGITSNLNKLSREGILFNNIYANSFRTDRGLVSILNGYLAQPTTSIMKYPAKSQTLPSIAKSLGEKGYISDMLYGGDINFTNMQSYFFSSGYNKITADRDFPLSSRLSKWGANDDITFAHLYEAIKLKETEQTPWFTTFLTLSSHEPFEVPYHRLENPYLNSVAFTDSCIGDFIEKLKTLPAWNNTLIILISDHGFRYPENLKEYEPGRYHIPMIWLGGAIKEPRIIETYGNQTDLAATLLNQLNLHHDQYIFSKDLLNPQSPVFAFYTYNNGFGFIDSTGISSFDCEAEKPLLEEPAHDSNIRLEKGKALLQTLYDDLGSR